MSADSFIITVDFAGIVRDLITLGCVLVTMGGIVAVAFAASCINVGPRPEGKKS